MLYITRSDISSEKKKSDEKILLGYMLSLIEEIEDEDLLKLLNCYEIVNCDITNLKQAAHA
jgi:hypothetical protein